MKLTGRAKPCESDPPVHYAVLEHLTGPSSGTESWLFENKLNISLDPRNRIHVDPPRNQSKGLNIVANLQRVEDIYTITANNGQAIWVNGLPIETKHLHHKDIIEFCETGPMSRFYLLQHNSGVHQSLANIFGDALAYFQHSRQPLIRRTKNSVVQVLRRLVVETTALFRLAVILAIGLLTVIIYQQVQLARLMQQQIEAGSDRMEEFSNILARSRKEALTPGDIDSLRVELGEKMSTTAGRVSKLEKLTTITQDIISSSAPSVVFLLGSYGFKDSSSGRFLRMILDESGNPRLLPNGAPLLSTEGDGPIGERLFTGSGFVLRNGDLLTNRHVGRPWEYESSIKQMESRGLKPVVTRFLAYQPGKQEGESVELVAVSQDSDLALLQYSEKSLRPKGLDLAAHMPKPGDQVIVMGYPTGMRALLAQAGGKFVNELQKSNNLSHWQIAAKLSRAGMIEPLASMGIVGRVSESMTVYDAETTHGGSGGPVLDKSGQVIAVNAAVLPEFGGSNLGVSISKVHQFLKTLDMN